MDEDRYQSMLNVQEDLAGKLVDAEAERNRLKAELAEAVAMVEFTRDYVFWAPHDSTEALKQVDAFLAKHKPEGNDGR